MKYTGTDLKAQPLINGQVADLMALDRESDRTPDEAPDRTLGGTQDGTRQSNRKIGSFCPESVFGAIDGADAFWLADRIAVSSLLVYVAEQDRRMDRMVQAMRFLHPDLRPICIPSWDCMPYDRVGPRLDLVAGRLMGLFRLREVLADKQQSPQVVMVTVNSLMQRVVPPRFLAERCLSLRVKTGAFASVSPSHAPVSHAKTLAYLGENAYRRVEATHIPGEYSVRGGLVDVFPPSLTCPVRLDFFGDELEGIREIDPVTQRSGRALEGVNFLPAREYPSDQASLDRFRDQYRNLFGADSVRSPLYESVRSGILPGGIEHWGPLFFEEETLPSILDLIPKGTPIALDRGVPEAIAVRASSIAERYRDRLQAPEQVSDYSPDDDYNPLPPEQIFLSEEALGSALAQHATAHFVVTPTTAQKPELPSHAPSVASITVPATAPKAALPSGGVAGAVGVQDAQGWPVDGFSAARLNPSRSLFDVVKSRVEGINRDGYRVLCFAESEGAAERLADLLQREGLDTTIVADRAALDAILETSPRTGRETDPNAATFSRPTVPVIRFPGEVGFELPGIVAFSELDVLGRRIASRARRGTDGERHKNADGLLAEAAALQPSDLVVHAEYGVGRFTRLQPIQIGGAQHECLSVEYADQASVHVPVENLDLITRYGGESDKLDYLGRSHWQERKARAKKRMREIADDLIEQAARREASSMDPVVPDPADYERFILGFEHEATVDQQSAIDDILGDLAKGRPMDRLVCGDAGAGKTEVALRAAYAVAENGRQVALLVPTTLLCRQHYHLFRKRFADTAINVAMLSRLVEAKDAKIVRRETAEGKIDILIGTHGLISESMKYHGRLGLVIVDEEQNFGVKQKECLKSVRAGVHLLSMTATPIPRTLQFALTGVREMSLIATPPVDRLAIRTFAMTLDWHTIIEAIRRERFRNGQTFFVCPRISDLLEIERALRERLPDLRVLTLHGQMKPQEVEARMADFLKGGYDLLLSTPIVESGLDIPSANTMIIHRADQFGLAQLYQLRGRVGRGRERGFCYLTVAAHRTADPRVERRLNVMRTLDLAGAGFSVASQDLELRGAGNPLGEEQSGNIREVGIELYQRLLEEAVMEARAVDEWEADASSWSPTLSLGISASLPETYVDAMSIRMGLYRRLASANEQEDIDRMGAEIRDRFGPLPPEVDGLLMTAQIKLHCRRANVERLEVGERGMMITFRNGRFPNPQGLIGLLQREPHRMKIKDEKKLFVIQAFPDPEKRSASVERFMVGLARMAQTGIARDKASGAA